MVRELVTINIGQAGIQLCEPIWEQYCAEHEIDKDGILKVDRKNNDGKIDCFFSEVDKNKFVPRNICIDTEPNVIDDIKNGYLKNLFYKENLINRNEDAANNFARGKYGIGREMIDEIIEKLNKTIETCDNLEGFFINHAVGGGTGSGVGDLVLKELEKHKKKTIIGFEIYPCSRISTCVVEPYNAVLATGFGLFENDRNLISLIQDNEKLYQICNKNLNLKRPSYSNINRLIAKSVSSLTASIRFEGELNLDVTDLKTNLVPFPKLHFMMTSLSPILTPEKMKTFQSDARTITDACFDKSNFFVQIPEYCCKEDKFLASLLMYRGNIKAKEANEATQWIQDNKKCNFVDWVPCGFKLCLNNKCVTLSNEMNENKEDLGHSENSAFMVGNNTGIGKVFSNILIKKFDLMYSQMAFVHHYVSEGMEQSEFEEARENIAELEASYLDAIETPDTESDDEI